jgi:hypothetical protein
MKKTQESNDWSTLQGLCKDYANAFNFENELLPHNVFVQCF